MDASLFVLSYLKDIETPNPFLGPQHEWFVSPFEIFEAKKRKKSWKFERRMMMLTISDSDS